MTGRREIFGSYRPGDTWLHRLPPWAKTVSVVVLFVVLFLPLERSVLPRDQEPWHQAAGWGKPLVCLLVVMALGMTAGIRWRSWWETVRPALPVFLLLALYHLLMGTGARGAGVLLTVVAAMIATRVLLETTPQAVLLDGVVRFLSPLRLLGVDPARVGLALQIMMRSVPFLMGVTSDVREAAAARGVRAGPVRLATPVVVAAVAHAQRTGEALVARGLE